MVVNCIPHTRGSLNSIFTLHLHFICTYSPGHRNLIICSRGFFDSSFSRALWTCHAHWLITHLTALWCHPFEESDSQVLTQLTLLANVGLHPPVEVWPPFIHLNAFNVEIETAQLFPQNIKAHSCLFCACLNLIDVSITDFFNKSDINQFVIHFLCYFLENLCTKRT